ncbi:MAG: ImmA/IrrE family metallo-endopeptidase [Alphaproteobacteria bacterium]|nr:MAG: ImmA/IrrE family metallo-endopeptidase [Alphaproteobacteria bacterium]
MRPAETLLSELGIASPDDIDVDAIARCVGAEVDYRTLVGSEAQIIGYRDRAVIYVERKAAKTRRRFSVGHELGHWHHHRGQSFVCRPDDIGRPIDEASRNAERLADAYSSDLLLPPFIIGPMIERLASLNLESVRDLAGKFGASVTSTAIRTMKMTKEPAILVVHNLLGRKWQWPGLSAAGLRVRDDVDARSSAFTAIASKIMTNERKEPASYWFDRRHIEQFDVRVQSMTTIEGECLSLIRIPDQRLLEIYAR